MQHITIRMIAFLLLCGFTFADDAPKPPAAEPVVTEIGQRRTPCYGTCPVYAVTIKRDGTFKYHGTEFVNHKGDWTGHLADSEFQRLAKLVLAADFANLKEKYSETITDHATVYTRVDIDGKSKVVEDYAHAGPEALRALEDAILSAIDHATWDNPKK
ncbi:MAG TPA: DUF6438 domain-containing protein [Tepidisphaeraceae bacterium]|jgi:hypothetical protein|nr:DUF6438 domain-containing protein [Tepidisphaeraceae bacterium]